MVHRPDWFREGQVYVSYAPTVGINKDGDDLFVVDPATGQRTADVDNLVAEDVEALFRGTSSSTSTWVDSAALTDRLMAVPVYFDDRPTRQFAQFLQQADDLSGFTAGSIASLIQAGHVRANSGHGSPSSDLRAGEIPYIKVSDLRAGQVNINPTNRVSEVVARKYWRGPSSGLHPYDLLTPLRTSKNIGDFAVLMPGQERVVLTKEILVLHATESAPFDNFYLLWAMSLEVVRKQWDRIVFMQTNREDAGSRYQEILLPIPTSRAAADACSREFREYYEGVSELRENFLAYLAKDDRHHVFMSSAAAWEDEESLDEVDA